MQDADYKRPKRVTAERILASLLVMAWIGLAYLLDGIATSVRAFLLFMVPLAIVWIPALFAKIALRDSRWETTASPPASAGMLRLIAWLVIVGVPLVWFILGVGR